MPKQNLVVCGWLQHQRHIIEDVFDSQSAINLIAGPEDMILHHTNITDISFKDQFTFVVSQSTANEPSLLQSCVTQIKDRNIAVRHLISGLNVVIAQVYDTNEILLCDGHSAAPMFRGISSLRNVLKISCGDQHILIAIRRDSTAMSGCQACCLFSCGSNKYGELGINNPSVRYCDSLQPVPILSNFNTTTTTEPEHSNTNNTHNTNNSEYPSIIDIACGSNHSIVVVEPGGEVYTFGCGAYLRLGHGDDQNRQSPTLVTALQGVGSLLSDGRMSGCVLVSADTWHSVAVSGSGDVYGWGWNHFGQIGSTGQHKNMNSKGELHNHCFSDVFCVLCCVVCVLF